MTAQNSADVRISRRRAAGRPLAMATIGGAVLVTPQPVPAPPPDERDPPAADTRGIVVTESADVFEAGTGTTDVRSDAVLMAAVRRGDTASYGVLYARHLGAVRRIAARWTGTHAEREDAIAEAFTLVLRALRAGRGPDELFLPYLAVTVRNAVIGWHRRDSQLSLVADVPEPPGSGAAAGEDPMGRRLHASMAVDAFAVLPERWRMVLWQTEVEGRTPAQLTSLFGTTPNGVAALAHRAREGLREAYLAQYLPAVAARACRQIIGRLPRWVQHGCAPRASQQITNHLDRCAECRELATTLTHLNPSLRHLSHHSPSAHRRSRRRAGADHLLSLENERADRPR
jgi:RNA polymerase sigma factor (sigma-70 family)